MPVPGRYELSGQRELTNRERVKARFLSDGAVRPARRTAQAALPQASFNYDMKRPASPDERDPRGARSSAK